MMIAYTGICACTPTFDNTHAHDGRTHARTPDYSPRSRTANLHLTAIKNRLGTRDKEIAKREAARRNAEKEAARKKNHIRYTARWSNSVPRFTALQAGVIHTPWKHVKYPDVGESV